MSFCNMFGGRKDKHAPAVSTVDVVYKMIPLPALKKIEKEGDKNEGDKPPKRLKLEDTHLKGMEHLFENPDEDSPVAAVSCKLDDGKIQVELYSRAGHYDDMIARMANLEIACFNKDVDVHPSTLGSTSNGKPVHDKSVRLIGFEENITLRKSYASDKASDAPNTVLAECFGNLANAPLLSEDPAMRDAMIRKIYKTLPVLGAAVERATPSLRAKG